MNCCGNCTYWENNVCYMNGKRTNFQNNICEHYVKEYIENMSKLNDKYL